MSIVTAESLGIPSIFNVATHFVDRNVAAGRGAKVAIECGDQRITYAETLASVNRVGTALKRLGVRPEERIAILLYDGPEFVYSFFGAIKIGAIPIPLNTLWKPGDYGYVLRDSNAVAVIVCDELLPSIGAVPPEQRRSVRHIITVGPAGAAASHQSMRFSTLLEQGEPECEPEPTSRDAAAFWMYSSGSTGAPKGCVHLHHDMVICADLVGSRVFGIAERDRTYSVAKLFFAYGLGNALYFPFHAGATTILWPGPPTPVNVFSVIERHRPTIFFSVPTGYAMMLAFGRPEAAGEATVDVSSLRLAVSAGEALPAPLYERFKQRFGVDILDGIGSTENLHMFISNRPGAIRSGSSGQIVDGYEARILDEHGAPTPRGEIGNLWISGDSICTGYWNQHEKTKHTIEGRWVRTGDKYSVDEDGYYWYAGRSDDMLKVGGQWVSPVEVENALVAHDAVLECGVIGREDQDGLVKTMAFVVLRPGIAPSLELAKELQQHVRMQLAPYKRPQWVEFIPELPKTATGKIQRYRLREIAAAAR
jgi:benzoate-CoA ligase family protein